MDYIDMEEIVYQILEEFQRYSAWMTSKSMLVTKMLGKEGAYSNLKVL